MVSQPAFRVLQFHDSAVAENHSCEGDFEWEFFYTNGGELESVTWNSDKPVSVASLFPAKGRLLYSAETAPGMTAMVFVRRLPGGRVLLSNVVSPVQTEVRQTVLMRTSSVGRFFPWLAARLEK